MPHSNITTTLYLVQHGQAMSAEEDPDRPLTPEGVESVQRMGAFAQATGIGVDRIQHSGKRRAEQTAQILASHLQPSGGTHGVSGLGPNDDVVPFGRTAAGELGDTLVVGHLPFLARLAGWLVTGDPQQQVVRFRNAGIVCLREDDGAWAVDWAITPGLLT